MMDDDSNPCELRVALAALADGLDDDCLPPARRAALTAHVVRCPTCAHELAVQTKIRARLARAVSPAEPAPESLVAMVRGLAREDARPARRAHRALVAAAASGWLVAAVLAVSFVRPEPATPNHVPMVAAVLRDFERALASELPSPDGLSTLAATIGHPVARLEHPDLQLIAVWPTEIRGETVAALAYRLRDRVIVQYVLSESLFYRQSKVREAVEAHGLYATTDGPRCVIAFAGDRSGSVLVGVMPADQLALLAPH